MSVFPVATKMRVAAPKPSIALRLFEHGDQPCQRCRVETSRYCNAPPACQFNQQRVVLLCVRCGLLNKLDRRQRQLRCVAGHGGGRKSIAMAGMRAILVERRQRQTMLTAELRPTQTTLRVRCGDLRHLRTAATMATTNCRNWISTHAFSESSSSTYEKNGLARRDTLDRPRQVRLYGKGRKERLCPLWPETVAALRQIINSDSGDEPVFLNACGAPLTRDGVAYLLDKCVRQASKAVPHLRTLHVTPHTMRHSCAVALLQAGVDVTVIRDYLGHASVATTSRYVTTNLKMKRDVLEAFWKRAGIKKESGRPWHPAPKLLAFLETL